MKRTRAALYARVSTEDQSCALQLAELRELAAARGWIVEEYVETASGASRTRPELARLRAALRRGRHDLVVVWRLDRLGRSLQQLVEVLGELQELGVDLVSLRDGEVDTTTPSGRLLWHMVAAFAEFERDLLRERTRAGMAAARARGCHIGRPRLEVDLEAVRKALAEGASLGKVAKAHGVARATLRDRLRGAPS